MKYGIRYLAKNGLSKSIYWASGWFKGVNPNPRFTNDINVAYQGAERALRSCGGYDFWVEEYTE